MRLSRLQLAFVGSFVTQVFLGGAVAAQSLPRVGESDEGWRHSITPYLYLPVSTQGTSTIDGVSGDIDLSLSEVLDLLQGAASVRYEGWNGDWGIQSDLYYVYIGEDGNLPGPAAADLELDVRQTYLTLAGSYRFAKGVNSGGNNYAADVSFGVKWNRLKQEINFGSPISRTLGGTEEWIEPMIGLRYAVDLNEDWRLGARVDLSGFGVNGDDLQYVVLAGADWSAWENVHLRFGYQFYGIDFSTETSSGTFAYDVDQHGPYIGLAFHF